MYCRIFSDQKFCLTGLHVQNFPGVPACFYVNILKYPPLPVFSDLVTFPPSGPCWNSYSLATEPLHKHESFKSEVLNSHTFQKHIFLCSLVCCLSVLLCICCKTLLLTLPHTGPARTHIGRN